jgi:hypothetical protein
MHEVRVTVPDGQSGEVARVALGTGIEEVSVYRIYSHGPNQVKEVVAAETSTPRARAFIDALFQTEWFDLASYSITTRELRSIVAHGSIAEVTRPMVEPALDVLQDLWQLSHVTSSYIGRAAAAAILLAYGMFENSAISIVIAALFLPFLSQVLSISFGIWAGDWALAKVGFSALCVSTAVSIAAGALVAALHPANLAFSDFKRPLVSFALSSVIGIAAGLASADDAGRRYLIGVAAAVQYAVFPVWFGISLVCGFPPMPIVLERIESFGINFVTIGVTSVCVYGLIGMRREEVGRLRSKVNSRLGAIG